MGESDFHSINFKKLIKEKASILSDQDKRFLENDLNFSDKIIEV